MTDSSNNLDGKGALLDTHTEKIPSTINNSVVEYNTQNSTSIYRSTEMQYSRSEDVLDSAEVDTPIRLPSAPLLKQACASKDDSTATTTLKNTLSSSNLLQQSVSSCKNRRKSFREADWTDPELFIREIFYENDLHKFILFKTHYDRHIDLKEKYQESREFGYELEEQYNEVKKEKDYLTEKVEELRKHLESSEELLRNQDQELFLHYEKCSCLEEQIEKLKREQDAYNIERERLVNEQASTLQQLQLQTTQSENTRKNFERARLDTVNQITNITNERNLLLCENIVLKNKLQINEDESDAERRRREERIAILNNETVILRHEVRHLKATALHAISCKRGRRCSICIYAKRTFSEANECHKKEKLSRRLRKPLQDLLLWLRSVSRRSSPLNLQIDLSIDHGMAYIDDSSSSSEDNDDVDNESVIALANISMSSINSGLAPISFDSGYVIAAITTPATPMRTPIDGNFYSNSYWPELVDHRSHSYKIGGGSQKISDSSLNCKAVSMQAISTNGGGHTHHKPTSRTFTRSKWTSFRRLFDRKS